MTVLADQLRLLLPPVSYDGMAPLLSAAIEAEANALSQSDVQAEVVYSAIFADSGKALADWERVLSLPDRALSAWRNPSASASRLLSASCKPEVGRADPFLLPWLSLSATKSPSPPFVLRERALLVWATTSMAATGTTPGASTPQR